MKRYELWLDESGDFQPSSQTNKRTMPSLVGGILIESGVFSEDRITEWTSVAGTEGFAHGTDYQSEQAQTIVLRALEEICRAGGRLVYFENVERIKTFGHRELYLRLLACGLVQLFRFIGKEGAFLLDIYIALRVDIERGMEQIPDDEYIKLLRNYIAEERRNGRFDLEAGSVVNISIMSARQERRLQLADFACNARLTRNSRKFEGVRERLYALFDDDYIFSFRIQNQRDRILSMVAVEKIADAFLELYTGYGKLDHKEVFDIIMHRFAGLSYRLQRLQLRTFVSGIVSFVRSETDFERSENICRQIIDELFAGIKNRGIDLQTEESLFEIYAWLLDMYLREGDVIHAAPVIERMETLISDMDYPLEHLWDIYLFLDRKALYQINCMDYVAAMYTMEYAICILEDMLSVMRKDGDLIFKISGRDTIRSEYLGDAYCMKVYAEMFLQRKDETLYERCLKKDTESALKQYGSEGELERNRQYRAHVEMRQGYFKEALMWLLLSARVTSDGSDMQDACGRYLQKALQEDPLSRNYYLMYYIELMQEADAGEDPSLSGMMEKALRKCPELYELFFSEEGLKSRIRSDKDRHPVIHENLFNDVLNSSQREYHPVEIIYWKFGLYLYGRGRFLVDAIRYFEKAIQICNANTDYLMMKVTALAILLDWYVVVSERKETDQRRQITQKLRAQLKKIDIDMEIPAKIRDYVQKVTDFTDQEIDGEADMEKQNHKARELALEIAY